MRQTIRTLTTDILGAQIAGDADAMVQSIAFDSRQVQPGGMFVALRGGYVDGHDFLDAARSNGATTAMVEPGPGNQTLDGFDAVVEVANTRQTLAQLSANFYGHPSHNLLVIGVTGTDGKTTTSWYLHQLLESLGTPTGLISTVAVKVPGQPSRSSARQTTPESLDVQSILAEIVSHGGKAVVLESTSHALETHRVDWCRFDAGVITNVTREHLDFHGSVENYRQAKAGLLRRVDASRDIGGRGVAIVNMDDDGARSIAPQAGGSQVIWYSRANVDDVSVRAANVETTTRASTFDMIVEGARYPVEIPFPGSWNVSNFLAAASALWALGYDANAIAQAAVHLNPVPGRLAAVDVGQDFTVVVDYAHTPESIKSVLTEMRSLTSGRLLITFGSAGERDIEKRAMQGRIAAELSDYAVFTSEDPRFEDPDAIIAEIAGGAAETGWRRGVDFECIEDRREALYALISRARPGDVVVLAGKGHESSLIYGQEQRPWDEATVAREVLIELGYGRDRVRGT